MGSAESFGDRNQVPLIVDDHDYPTTDLFHEVPRDLTETLVYLRSFVQSNPCDDRCRDAFPPLNTATAQGAARVGSKYIKVNVYPPADGGSNVFDVDLFMLDLDDYEAGSVDNLLEGHLEGGTSSGDFGDIMSYMRIHSPRGISSIADEFIQYCGDNDLDHVDANDPLVTSAISHSYGRVVAVDRLFDGALIVKFDDGEGEMVEATVDSSGDMSEGFEEIYKYLQRVAALRARHASDVRG